MLTRVSAFQIRKKNQLLKESRYIHYIHTLSGHVRSESEMRFFNLPLPVHPPSHLEFESTLFTVDDDILKKVLMNVATITDPVVR